MILQIITIVMILFLTIEIVTIKRMLKRISGAVNEYLDNIIDSENELERERRTEEQNLVISRVLEELFP